VAAVGLISKMEYLPRFSTLELYKVVETMMEKNRYIACRESRKKHTLYHEVSLNINYILRTTSKVKELLLLFLGLL